MIRSMTAFASAKGARDAWSWAWELRSVNARGLDLRIRVPDWLTGLETALRTDLGKALSRGSVTLGLRVSRGEEAAAVQINETALERSLDALGAAEDRALERGFTLAPSRASDLLGLRGVLETAAPEDDPAPLVSVLRSEFPALLADFVAMREREGAALAGVLEGQLAQVADLTARAADLAEARKDAVAANLRENLSRVMDNVAEADPDRVAQELALIAVKADVTEEIDRLRAHVAAARDLLGAGGPVGRKLDFLMQEFNREANTLCSKAGARDLTSVGLELKAVIDQMREQVQNVE